MKIILTLPDEFDSENEEREATEFVKALQGAVERKLDQGFPGLMMERGDGSVWVCKVEMVL